MSVANNTVTVTAAEAAAIPTLRAAYSDRTAALMAAMAQWAYLPFEVTSRPRTDGPKPGREKTIDTTGEQELRARLKTAGFDLVSVYNHKDTQAYYAIGQTAAVLSFRGTTDGADWVTNLKAAQVELPMAPGVWVHVGFWEAFKDCEPKIRADLATLDIRKPLYIVGHSLGGALAQIASAIFESPNLAACYTFGSPRVARRDFDLIVKCPHYRVVHHQDIVPTVPPPVLLRYRRSGDGRWLTGKPEVVYRGVRSGLAEAAAIVCGLIRWPISRALLFVADHAIGLYYQGLKSVSDARNGGSGPQAAALRKAVLKRRRFLF